MSAHLWQLYDTQCRPLPGRGAAKQTVAVRGLLHGAAHVWVWRRRKGAVELLVQRRASYKVNWPGLYDKSAGGHLLLGETPMRAALRKTRTELGLLLPLERIEYVGRQHWCTHIDGTGLLENEFQWLYMTEFQDYALHLNKDEVAEIKWVPASQVVQELARRSASLIYVPYGAAYAAMLQAACDRITVTAARYTYP